MPNMAPQTAYQGSKGMKSYERSKADKSADRKSGKREGSAAERASDAKELSAARAGQKKHSRTIAGSHKPSRV